MKAISSSIITLAGAIVLSAGSLVGHSDTQIALQLIGGAIGLPGLVVWFTTLGPKSTDDRNS